MTLHKILLSLSLTALIPLQAIVPAPSNRRINRLSRELLAEEALANKVETGLQVSSVVALSCIIGYYLFFKDSNVPGANGLTPQQMASIQLMSQHLPAFQAYLAAQAPQAPVAPQPVVQTWGQFISGMPGAVGNAVISTPGNVGRAVKNTIVSIPGGVKNAAVGTVNYTVDFVKSDLSGLFFKGALGVGYSIALGTVLDKAKKTYPPLGRLLGMFNVRDLRWYLEQRTSFKILTKNVAHYAHYYSSVEAENKAQVRELLEDAATCFIEDIEKALGFMIFYVQRYTQESPKKRALLTTKVKFIRQLAQEFTDLFNDKLVKTQADAQKFAIELQELNKQIYKEINSFQIIIGRRALVDLKQSPTPRID